MARKHRKIKKAISPAADLEVSAAGWGFSASSGYDGANFSTRRGRVFWPTLDTRLEIDSFSRNELLRRIRWLFANVGFVRGLIRNSANLVGWMTPQAQTQDLAWNSLAEQVFRDRMMTSAAFDLAGKFNFHTAQPMLQRTSLKDGDVFTVLSEWGNGAACVAFYEAHQLENPPNAGTGWLDGVLLDRHGRHLAYGFRDSQSDRVVVVPAKDVIYFGDFDSSGHVRAIPPLAHGVNHGMDITEVHGFVKGQLKSASLFSVVRERESNAPAKSRSGLPGTLRRETNDQGDSIDLLDVWEGGHMAQLPPGEKAKILHDDRPSPNQMEFVETLIRDIAVGFGLPPEVVWRMANLTGPGVRFVMDVADRWIKQRQKLNAEWARRVWVYTLAKEIKAGRLPLPQSDSRWWAVKFTAQRNLTIDRGREAKARMDAIAMGLGTFSDWYEEMDGADWEEQILQRVREVDFAKKQCQAAGLDYAEVFPPRQGAAAPPVSEPASAADPSSNPPNKNSQAA